MNKVHTSINDAYHSCRRQLNFGGNVKTHLAILRNESENRATTNRVDKNHEFGLKIAKVEQNSLGENTGKQLIPNITVGTTK